MDGNYSFDGLRPSDAAGYTVVEAQPVFVDGDEAAGPLGGDAISVNDQISGIVIGPDDSANGNTFGEHQPATVSGSVYVDADNDGVFDAGETGIAGVDVTLTGTDAFGDVVDVTVQTDVDGEYLFSDVRASDANGYTITETQPAGFLDGIDAAGSLGGVVGDDVVSGIVVAGGEAGTDYDFGELVAASLSGSVFEDVNNDGVLDAGEVGIAGVDVTLTGTDDLGNVIDVTVQTDVDGAYVFAGLRPSDVDGYTHRNRNRPALSMVLDSVGSLGW